MNFLDLLFPKNCLECKRPGKYICTSCLGKVEPAKLICPVCRKYSFNGQTHSFCVNKFSLSGMHTFYQYDGVIRKAILALKYRFAFDIAKELVENLGLEIDLKNAILVPVPLHKKRENWRGFNQAALLGKLLADKAGWRFSDNLLLRQEASMPQVKLSKKERLQNIRGKFALKTSGEVPLSGTKWGKSKIIIFDDVWTTGATMAEACSVLKKAGIDEVWGMSVARS